MDTPKITQTFILVHGAWHGAWCWDKLTPFLQRSGQTVLAPDLPGLGLDRTPLADITFTSYVDRVLSLVDRAQEPVILVGHSLGGMTISQVAETRPEKIRRLVYLAALLPRHGESAFEANLPPQETLNDQQEAFSRCMEMDGLSVQLHLDDACSFLYHDCGLADEQRARKLLKPQALMPMHTPVSLSHAFASVPRTSIVCTSDRVIPPMQQEYMATQTPCKHILRIHSGHSPFMSQPERLAALLQGLSLPENQSTEKNARRIKAHVS